MNRSPSQIFLSLSLCIAISSSNSITFSLKCVMQILIFSVIVFWSNWLKLSLISLIATALLKCPDLISKVLEIYWKSTGNWKETEIIYVAQCSKHKVSYMEHKGEQLPERFSKHRYNMKNKLDNSKLANIFTKVAI